jgi:hypothetical protein
MIALSLVGLAVTLSAHDVMAVSPPLSSFQQAAATAAANTAGPERDVCFGSDKTDVRLEHVTLLLPATIEGQTRHLAPFVLRVNKMLIYLKITHFPYPYPYPYPYPTLTSFTPYSFVIPLLICMRWCDVMLIGIWWLF